MKLFAHADVILMDSIKSTFDQIIKALKDDNIEMVGLGGTRWDWRSGKDKLGNKSG